MGIAIGQQVGIRRLNGQSIKLVSDILHEQRGSPSIIVVFDYEGGIKDRIAIFDSIFVLRNRIKHIILSAHRSY